MTGSVLRVSVIVPSRGRPLALLRCLLALEEQEVPPYEVLVAIRHDDDQTAQTAAAWQAAGCRIMPVDVGAANASVARNCCIACATGDVLAFIDDDVVPRPAWIAELQGVFTEHPAVGGVGGPDWIDGDEARHGPFPTQTGAVQWWGRRIGNHHRGAPGPRAVSWLKGANMAYRREALADIRFGEGLLGDAAQFAEDVQLSLRVRRAGWQLQYHPAVAVDHYPGPTRDGHDHRALADNRSLHHAAHNETVALLAYLPPIRRLAFLVWAFAAGTRLLPGAVAALVTRGRLATRWWHWRVVARGRWDGWSRWRQLRRRSATSTRRDRRATETLDVCLVTHVVRRNDGQGRVNLELARWLVRHHHRVTLVASDVDPALAAESGIRWTRIPVPRYAPAPVQWACFAWGARRVLGANPRRRFDVVHLNGAIAPVQATVNTSHFVHHAWHAALPAAAMRGPGLVYQRAVARICAALERRAYHAAARVVAVSESVRASLDDTTLATVAPVTVIHTGVDADEFQPRCPGEPSVLRGHGAVPAGAFVALFVGDIRSPRKNLDLALRTVARSEVHVHLVVVGNAARSRYPAMARALGIGGRVHFVGPRTDVAECYRDADVVFCAGHYEPASLVLLEAMASGAPVITACQVGNAAFIVDGRNGFLLRSPDDVERAVEIVERLVQDPPFAHTVGMAARTTAAELTWSRMAEGYESLYRGVVAASGIQ